MVKLRIAYFLSWSQGDVTGPADGVRKKIGENLRAQRRSGVEAKLFVLASRPCEHAWAKELPRDAFEIVLHSSRLGRERACAAVGAAIEKYAPDVVYSRQEPFYPALLPTFRRFPLVIELNGNEAEEARGAPTYYRAYRRVSREIVARLATGIVAVSNEFLSLQPYAGRGLSSVVIANGIDLSSIEPLGPATGFRRNEDELRFVFIGGVLGAAWHGVPKILELARVRPDWSFDLVGFTQADLGVEPLPNVTAHGVLPREQYRGILEASDIGIGSLSAHMKRNNEGSALKTREYLAHGLPTMIGYLDTDFMSEVPFLLQLPNTPSNVETSIDRIERFAREWKGRRVERSAILHLDTADKERRRIEFLRSAAARPR